MGVILYASARNRLLVFNLGVSCVVDRGCISILEVADRIGEMNGPERSQLHVQWKHTNQP